MVFIIISPDNLTNKSIAERMSFLLAGFGLLLFIGSFAEADEAKTAKNQAKAGFYFIVSILCFIVGYVLHLAGGGTIIS